MPETENSTVKIKKPNHLIYRKGFWAMYTAFSYAAAIFGGLSTLLSALELFESPSPSAPFHLLTSALFLAAGFVFLDARIYWGRLLLYTRKQDRQNELVINARDVDDYRQKEAERDRQQLQQMDKAIEAAVERKMGDFDERMELYTKQNARMQKTSLNQDVDYLESRLKRFDASLDKIAGMVNAKALEKADRDNLEKRMASSPIFGSRPAAKEEDDGIAFDTVPAPEKEDAQASPEAAPAGIPQGNSPEPDTSGISLEPEIDDFDEDGYDESLYTDEDLPDDLLSNA